MSTPNRSLSSWDPSGTELRSILDEMRPIISCFVERDRRRLAAWAMEDRVGGGWPRLR